MAGQQRETDKAAAAEDQVGAARQEKFGTTPRRP